jgi:hypothetical protein
VPPPTLHREHLSLPQLHDIQRQRHWRCREDHDPVPPARLPQRWRSNPHDSCGRGPQLVGETYRLSKARRLKRTAQARAFLIREPMARVEIW